MNINVMGYPIGVPFFGGTIMKRFFVLLTALLFSFSVYSQTDGSAEISKFINFYKTNCKGTFLSISGQELGDKTISWTSIPDQTGDLYNALSNQAGYAATLCYTAVNAPAKFSIMLEYRKFNASGQGYTVVPLKKSYSGTMTADNTFSFFIGNVNLELKAVPKDYMNSYNMLVEFGPSEPGVKSMKIEESPEKKWQDKISGINERGMQRLSSIAPKVVEMSEKDEDEIRLGDVLGAIGEVDLLGGVKKTGYEYSFAVINVAPGGKDLLPLTAADLSSMSLDAKAIGLGSDPEVTNEQVLIVFLGIYRTKNNEFEADLIAIGKGTAVDEEDGQSKDSWLLFSNTFYCSAVNFIDDSDEEFKQVALKRLIDVSKGTKRQLWSRKLSKGKFNVFNVGQKKVRTYDVRSDVTVIKEQDISVTDITANEKADVTATFRAGQGDIPDSFPDKTATNMITGISGTVNDIAKKLWPTKCDCQ